MSKEIKISSTISPFLEKKILEGGFNDEISTYLFSIKNNIKNYKHSIYHKIPVSIKHYFQSDSRVKIFFELIEADTQSNILIDPSTDKNIECFENIDNLFGEDFNYPLYSLQEIIQSIKNKNNEFLIGLNECQLEKRICNCQKEKVEHCIVKKKIKINKIGSNDEFIQNVKDFANIEFEQNWIFRCDNITELDIKKLFILYCKMESLGEEFILKIKEVVITNEFINDIRNLNKKDLIIVFTSLYRAILFPPTSSADRISQSIDYHTESNLNKFKNYFVYRIDAVNMSQSGIGNSGTKRINYVMKGDKKTIIAFTKDHDVPVETLKARINILVE